MANYCTIHESQRHQTLVEMSGVPEDSITLICNDYLNKYGRFPELDEIPNVDSSEYLTKEFDLQTTTNGTHYQNTQFILETTGTNSIQEANSQINESHKDLEVKIVDVDGTSIFEIEHRPNAYNVGDKPYKVNADSIVQQRVALTEALTKMQKLYGIKIIPITSQDQFPEELNISQAKAFIYNGNIYINTDNATIDSPIHEMLHIVIGGLSRSNPQLFYNLVQSVEQLPNFQERAQYYPNRSKSDIDEEIFVEELAKYITNQNSLFSNLDYKNISQIMYYIQRDLDTIMMGNYSVKSIDDLFNCSLLELSELTESNTFNVTQPGLLTDSAIHRMLANTKEEYFKSGDLTENCE